MNVNFFDEQCVTETICDVEFGINDNCTAYVCKMNIELCNARVKNNILKLRFVPIDNHMDLYRGNGERAKRCDCMLYDDDKTEIIIFIELKKKNKQRNASLGKNQLRETISFFNTFHSNALIKRKYAVLSNSLVPQINIQNQTTVYEFKNETGFFLLIQHEIDIKKLLA